MVKKVKNAMLRVVGDVAGRCWLWLWWGVGPGAASVSVLCAGACWGLVHRLLPQSWLMTERSGSSSEEGTRLNSRTK